MSVSGMKSPSVIRHWGNLDNKDISKARLNQAWINEDEDGDINVLVCLPIDYQSTFHQVPGTISCVASPPCALLPLPTLPS